MAGGLGLLPGWEICGWTARLIKWKEAGGGGWRFAGSCRSAVQRLAVGLAPSASEWSQWVECNGMSWLNELGGRPCGGAYLRTWLINKLFFLAGWRSYYGRWGFKGFCFREWIIGLAGNDHFGGWDLLKFVCGRLVLTQVLAGVFVLMEEGKWQEAVGVETVRTK